MDSASRFVLTDLLVHWDEVAFNLIAFTDVPCALALHHTSIPPLKYQQERLRRGLRVYPRIVFTFVPTATYPQTNLDTSIVHFFELPTWPPYQIEWFYFTATISGLDSVSQSPIFSLKNEEDVLSWSNVYTCHLFESMDGWDVSDMAGSGSWNLYSHYLQLQLGAPAPSRSHIFLRYRAWANFQPYWPNWFRVIAQFHNLPILPHIYLTHGSTWAGPQQYGFYINGTTVYLYTREPGGITSLPVFTLTSNEETLILEARFTDGVNVVGFINGNYVGEITTHLPWGVGYGPDFWFESDTETNTWLRIFRAETLKFGWSPFYG